MTHTGMPTVLVTGATGRVGRLVVDHLTGPESLSQSEQVRIIGEVLGRPIACAEVSPDEFRRQTAETWPRPAVEMLLAAWGATIGRPAFVTSTVSDILGRAPCPFRRWIADHADAFTSGPAGTDA